MGVNLYLLNPHGIVFGPNATLQVNGSFHASTASTLRFSDGGYFATRAGDLSVLSEGTPARLVFDGSAGAGGPAAIDVRGSKLHVPAGSTLSFSAPRVSVSGEALLEAPHGTLELVGVAASDSATPANGELLSVARGGEVTISGAARLREPSGSGVIRIRSGTFVLEDRARIENINAGEGSGGSIEVQATNSISFGSGAAIESRSTGDGIAGRIDIRGGDMRLTGSASVSSESRGNGGTAGIDVQVQPLQILADSQLVARTTGPGAAGVLSIAADEVIVDASASESRPAGILTATNGSGETNGIALTAAKVSVTGSGRIGGEATSTGSAGGIMSRHENRSSSPAVIQRKTQPAESPASASTRKRRGARETFALPLPISVFKMAAGSRCPVIGDLPGTSPSWLMS